MRALQVVLSTAMPRFAVLFPGLLLLASISCTAEPQVERLCTPDANVFCRCEDRSEGVKQCNGAGSAFGACECLGARRTGDAPVRPDGPPEIAKSEPASPRPGPEPRTTSTEPEPTAPEEPKPAAPEEPKPVPPGPLCEKLTVCCGQLGAAGYLTETCEGVAATKNEDACYASHKNYKDYGDCT